MATTLELSPLAQLLSEATEGRLTGMQLGHLIQDILKLLGDDLQVDRSRHLEELKRKGGLQKGYVHGYEIGYDQVLIDLQSAGSLFGATAQRQRERDG